MSKNSNKINEEKLYLAYLIDKSWIANFTNIFFYKDLITELN